MDIFFRELNMAGARKVQYEDLRLDKHKEKLVHSVKQNDSSDKQMLLKP
jgi:hypothetical protein